VSIANTEQAEHWNTGPGVAHWVANQARYDRMHAPFTALNPRCRRPAARRERARRGLRLRRHHARPPPGSSRRARHSAWTCPARCWPGPAPTRRRPAWPTWRSSRGDAQVEPLEPGRFDTVISRFGVMFFADPVAAFANIRSRPGPAAGWSSPAGSRWPPTSGCWSPAPPWPSTCRRPPPLPPAVPACSPSPTRTGSARSWPRPGWRDVEITSEHASILVGGGGSVDDAVEFLRTATQGRTMLAGADAATAERALASLRAALTPHADADGVHLDAAVWLVQAVTP